MIRKNYAVLCLIMAVLMVLTACGNTVQSGQQEPSNNKVNVETSQGNESPYAEELTVSVLIEVMRL